MAYLEIELAKGRERMSTVCSIATKRILATRELLEIPETPNREECLVVKDERSISIVTNTANDVNRMLDIEITNLGVRVAVDGQVMSLVDKVRTQLAELITILGKGREPADVPPPVINEVVEDDRTAWPWSLTITATVAVLLAVIMVFIAVDSSE